MKWKIFQWLWSKANVRYPEWVTAITLYWALKEIRRGEALEHEHPIFIFSILIATHTALPLIVDCTPSGVPYDDAVTLDAWWTEEAKSLVQPIVDKINLLSRRPE